MDDNTYINYEYRAQNQSVAIVNYGYVNIVKSDYMRIGKSTKAYFPRGA